MIRHTFALALSLLLAVGSSCAGCDSANTTELTGLLSPDVTRIDFGDVFIGTTQTRTLTLSSLGTGAVFIDSAEVNAPFGSNIALPYSMNPNEVLAVELFVTPTIEGSALGVMEFVTDADNARRLEIELSVNALPRPPCDDDNVCTADVFDEVSGNCAYTFRQGPCDDGNQCTQADRCSNGICVGEFLECSDGVDCTTDACSPEEGCIFVSNDDACSDDDPCTLDFCTEEGCESEPAPDYTVCGDVESCVAAEICLAQVCVSVEIPDGVPCSDGDACTIDNICAEGICLGEVSSEPPGIVETRLLSSPLSGNILRRGNVFFDHSSRAIEYDEGVFIPRMIASLGSATSIHELDGRYAIVVGFDLDEGASSIVDFSDPLVPVAVAHASISLIGGDETMVWGCSQNEVIRIERTALDALGEAVVIGSCNNRVRGRGGYVYEFDGDRTLLHQVGADTLISLGSIEERVEYSSTEKIWLLNDADDNFSLLDITNAVSAPIVLPTGFLQAMKSGRVLWRNTLNNTSELYTHTPQGIDGPSEVEVDTELRALSVGYVDDDFIVMAPLLDDDDFIPATRTFVQQSPNTFVAAPLLGQISFPKNSSSPVLVSGDEVLMPWTVGSTFQFTLQTPTQRVGPNLTGDRPNVLASIVPEAEGSGLWQFGESLTTIFNQASPSIASTSVQDTQTLINYYSPPPELTTINLARGEGCGFFASATQTPPDAPTLERGIAHIDRCLDTNANLRALSLLTFFPSIPLGSPRSSTTKTS